MLSLEKHCFEQFATKKEKHIYDLCSVSVFWAFLHNKFLWLSDFLIGNKIILRCLRSLNVCFIFNSTIHKFLLLGSCTKIHTMSWQINSQVISFTIKKGLTLIKHGSGRTVKYWDLISFDLAFTRFKFTCSGICQVGKRALKFREFSKNSAIPLVYWERARE